MPANVPAQVHASELPKNAWCLALDWAVCRSVLSLCPASGPRVVLSLRPQGCAEPTTTACAQPVAQVVLSVRPHNVPQCAEPSLCPQCGA
jgi:hypothetical protein